MSPFGLTPRVRQSGLGAAHHGRIEPRLAAVTRAPCGSKPPGPRRGVFIRVRAKRGHPIAAVAVARRRAVLCRHRLTKGEDHRWARARLVAHQRRAMARAAGQPHRKGNRRGAACA